MEEKKKMHPALKAVLTVVITLVLAIVFGIVSGGIFLGVSIGGTAIANQMGIGTPEVLTEPESEIASEDPSEAEIDSEENDSEEAASEQNQDGVNATIHDGSATLADAAANANLTDVSDVVEQVMPSIVSIIVVSEIEYYGFLQDSEGAGSGFVVGQNDTDLFVATNYHVIEDTKDIKVQFCDNETVPASVKGKNIAMDLAVLAIDLNDIPQQTKDEIHVATLGDSESLRVGEPAIAIGNALGYGQSVTTGVISALNREVVLQNGSTGVFIQTDAAINPGNSGGALLNTNGEVIGINSNKLGGDVVEGMGYAIPISAAEPIINGLINKEEIAALPESEQGYLGISALSVTSEIAASQPVETPYGVYISRIVSGGPAEQAGLKMGDIITGYDGNLIETMEDLTGYLSSVPAGTVATITYMRLEGDAYTEHECTVILTNKPTSN